MLEAEANSLINLGIDYTHSGNKEETISAFHKVRDIFERDAWFRWRYNIRLHAAMAEHWLRLGDTAKAREIVTRLLETARKYEVHKYTAVGHKLLAEIAIAKGDTPTAETEFAAALDELRRYPVPVVEWTIYAELGRVKARTGDDVAARDAFAKSAEIIDRIAASVGDESLREIFLKSDVVRQVKTRATMPATS